MSTVPDDAWRDAGLEGIEDTTSLVEEEVTPEEEPETTEDYRPRTARPDLDGEANEADVVEQSQVVPELADDPDVDDNT
jgi:hypothetical protein